MKKILLVFIVVVGLLLISGCVKLNSGSLELKIFDQNLLPGETLSVDLEDFITVNGVSGISFALVNGVGTITDGTYTFESTLTSEGPYPVTVKAMSAEGKISNCTFTVYMCEFTENFPSGSLADIDVWLPGGEESPTEESSVKHSGENSVKFEAPLYNRSTLEATVTLAEDAVISFWLKTEMDMVNEDCPEKSSYSYINFYVNNKNCSRWNGDHDWFEVVRELPAGEYRLKWELVHGNYDDEPKAWLDSIAIQNNRDLGDVVIINDADFKSGLYGCYLAKREGDIYELELKDLFELRAHSWEIEDFTGIEAMSNLEVAIIPGNNNSDFSSFSSLSKLKRIYANSSYGLENLNGLSGLNNLEFLKITDASNLTDISGISGLVNLDTLFLADISSIPDFSTISNLNNLTTLKLGYDDIDNLSFLQNLTNLEVLRLGSNSIEDLSPLSTLVNLKDLRIGNNNISNLNPLASLTNLEILTLGYNSITDLSALTNLVNLEELGLCGNTGITDLDPLVNNSGLGTDDYVYLRSILLSPELETDITTLENRGVHVQLDPPKSPDNSSKDAESKEKSCK